MNLKYTYWAFKEAIPPKICDDIIKYYHLKKNKIDCAGLDLKQLIIDINEGDY